MSESVPTTRIVRASGRSMFPLIRDGAEVGLVQGECGSITPGEIVAFRAGGRTLVHRVLEVRRDGELLRLREKGDGNAVSSWITERDLEGRAAWVGCRGALRRLAPPASPFAVRLLTRGSRVEADLADALRAGLVRGGRARGSAAAAVGGLLRPFKALALPLLAAAYPFFSLDDESAAAEREFLLACCRRDLDPATPVAGSKLDGMLLLQGAVTHGVVPAVQRWSGAALPAGIAGELRRATLRAGLAHLGALETFREAAAALDEAGVPHLVLKGLALAHLYSSGAERFSTDLDLLVAPADRERARRALLAAGYSAPGGVAARLLDRVHFHVSLAPRAPGRVPIELHWGLTDRACLARIPAEELLARRRESRAGATAVPVPAPVDEFLYLTVHAARHGILNRAGLRAGLPAAWFLRPCVGNRLLWFADLQRHFVRHETELDAGLLRRRAVEWNVDEEVAEALRLLRLLLPGPAADAACDRCGVPPATPARSGAGRRGAAPTAGRLFARLMRMNARLLFRPARLTGLGRTLFPAPARLRRYWRARHAALVPLLYLVHPVHMVARILGLPGGFAAAADGRKAPPVV